MNQTLLEQFESLLRFIKASGRVCPQPQAWNKLYEMLPDKKRVGNGWEPPLPLILAAWWDTPNLMKMMRLQEHIDYALAKGVLPEVDRFLRSLRDDEWHHLDGSD